MSVALPLPSDERLLRGLLDALGGIDVAGRQDLQHQIGMLRMVVEHLVRRRDLSGLSELYDDMIPLIRKADARFGFMQATTLPETLSTHSYDAAQGQIGAASSSGRCASAAHGAGILSSISARYIRFPEPLKTIRLSLDSNELGIEFDILWHGMSPAYRPGKVRNARWTIRSVE